MRKRSVGVTLWTPTLMRNTMKRAYHIINGSLVEKLQSYRDLKITTIRKARKAKVSERKTLASLESHFSWQANCIPTVAPCIRVDVSCVGTITLDHPRFIVFRIRGLLRPLLLMSCRSTIFLMLYAGLLM